MDDDRLISKKEVLEETGISYGQLYRWKRKGLIPEAWFIRRSTFTGQETFFPRDKILERIQRIKDMKDEHPLDDLADLITHQVNSKLQFAFEKLREMKWLDDAVIQGFRIDSESSGPVSLEDAFSIGVASEAKASGRSEEHELIHRTLKKAIAAGLLDRLPEEPLQLYLLRKRVSGGGISAEISLSAIGDDKVLFDPDSVEIARIDLSNVMERIRLDLAKAADAAAAEEFTGA